MAPKRNRSLDDMRQRKEEIEREEAELNGELKRLKVETGKIAKRASQSFTAFQKDVAVTIYLLGGWKADPAVDYLFQLRGGCTDAEQLVEFVETWVLEVPLDVLIDMDEEDMAPKATVYKKASDNYLKWRLARWVEHENVEHGLTPPTASVLRHHDLLLGSTGAGGRGGGRMRGDSSMTRNRLWAIRWRKSHAVSLGVPRVVDNLPVPEMRFKALAAWQLYNHYAAHASGRVVRINLDETRVLFYVRSGVGNVAMVRGAGARPARARPRQIASKGGQRAAMTHVGIVCDDTSLQGYLPQVFIASDRLILARDVLATEADLPPYTYLLRGTSSWNSTEKMVHVIRLLGTVLRARAPDALPILSMDAVRLHLGERVLRECARWGIRVVVVPAKLTWLLQQLDTHVFAKMKRALRDAYQERVGREGARALSTRGRSSVTFSAYLMSTD